MTARLAAEVPAGTEVLTGTQITQEAQNSIEEGLGFFNTFLLVFAAIGLVVACFTIYNTFQIIITQRTREMALLRSLGATRRQVMWTQLLEAVFIGLFVSIIGLFAGVGVAGLLKAMLSAFGIDIPAGGTVFAARTAVVALVVGTGVTIVSAVFPSRRASRVPPIAAIRDVAIDHSGGRFAAWLPVRCSPCLASGHRRRAGRIRDRMGRHRGAGNVRRGVHARTADRGPVTRAIGAPLPAVAGITGSLARENAMRNRSEPHVPEAH